jgi:hypothetical protein
MFRKKRMLLLATALLLLTTACRSHETKVAELQKQYDDAEAQFRKDCNEEYLKVPPTLSPKCSDEDKKTKEAWNRLQAERAKQ